MGRREYFVLLNVNVLPFLVENVIHGINLTYKGIIRNY